MGFSTFLRLPILIIISDVLLFRMCHAAVDVDFGKECKFGGSLVNCIVDLKLEDSQCEGLGFIQTPDFPNPILDPPKYGRYAVKITACEDTTVLLTLSDNEFSLEPVTNQFRVGDGDIIGQNVRPPILNGGDGSNELPNGVTAFSYSSTGNQMWIEADLSKGFGYFKIQYTIVKQNIQKYEYTENYGDIVSPETYPQDGMEQHHIIYANSSDYQDLLLTVNYIDVSGMNGDYLKLGPGLDYEVDVFSSLVSWEVNKGNKFLINGNKAYIVFKTFVPIVAEPKRKGFSISYEAIPKALTTPIPTTPSPTTIAPLLPLDPLVLAASIVATNYSSNQTLKQQLKDMVLEYISSEDRFKGGEIIPPISNETIVIDDFQDCYHGWSVSMKTCRKLLVQVNSFFMPNNDESGASNNVEYALKTNDLIKAVRSFGGQYQIKLPQDMWDVYTEVAIIGGCVLAVVILALLFVWRQRLRSELRANQKYIELKYGQAAAAAAASNPAAMPGVKTILRGASDGGVENAAFTNEEGEPVWNYDPEQGTFYSSGGYVSQPVHSVPTNGSISESFSRPSTSSFLPFDDPPATVAMDGGLVSKRGILLSRTAVGSSSLIPNPAEMEEVVLFESNLIPSTNRPQTTNQRTTLNNGPSSPSYNTPGLVLGTKNLVQLDEDDTETSDL